MSEITQFQRNHTSRTFIIQTNSTYWNNTFFYKSIFSIWLLNS